MASHFPPPSLLETAPFTQKGLWVWWKSIVKVEEQKDTGPLFHSSLLNSEVKSLSESRDFGWHFTLLCTKVAGSKGTQILGMFFMTSGDFTTKMISLLRKYHIPLKSYVKTQQAVVHKIIQNLFKILNLSVAFFVGFCHHPMISEIDLETHRSAVVVETSQGRKSQDPKEDDLSRSTVYVRICLHPFLGMVKKWRTLRNHITGGNSLSDPVFWGPCHPGHATSRLDRS